MISFGPTGDSLRTLAVGVSLRCQPWITPVLRRGVFGVGPSQRLPSVSCVKEAGNCTGLSSVPGATVSGKRRVRSQSKLFFRKCCLNQRGELCASKGLVRPPGKAPSLAGCDRYAATPQDLGSRQPQHEGSGHGDVRPPARDEMRGTGVQRGMRLTACPSLIAGASPLVLRSFFPHCLGIPRSVQG